MCVVYRRCDGEDRVLGCWLWKDWDINYCGLKKGDGAGGVEFMVKEELCRGGGSKKSKRLSDDCYCSF